MRRRTTPSAHTTATVGVFLPEPVGLAGGLRLTGETLRHARGAGLFVGSLTPNAELGCPDLGPRQGFVGLYRGGRLIPDPPIAAPNTSAPEPNPILAHLARIDAAMARP